MPPNVIDVAPALAVPVGIPDAVPLASSISGGMIVKFYKPDLCWTIKAISSP